MSVPQVAIIGRPNVGKSSLFNWLVGDRAAIVDAVAGVTRDRLTRLVELEGRYVELIDTGGIGLNDVDDLREEIEQQIGVAIDRADLVLFVVDIREGTTPLDLAVAQRLRRTGKPVLLVANKTDHEGLVAQQAELYGLGMGVPVCVSAQNRRGREELLTDIAERLPTGGGGELPAPEMKIAIVGRRNVGKSTFVNALSESDRMIVSPIAGTTRDSVDVRFEMDGKTFVAIDTAGVRKRKSVRTDVEFYGLHRAQRSIRRADVVLMFFDSSSRISGVDRQLIQYLQSHDKPCILVVNKWDLMAPHMATERWGEYLRRQFPGMDSAPIAFVSARDGRNVKRLINQAQQLFKQAQQRVATPDLNRWLRATLEQQPPPIVGGRRGKVYFGVQVGIRPPTIVLKCNDPGAFSAGYRRFLLRALREVLPFGEVPIRLLLERRTASAVSAGDEGESPEE